MKQLLFPALAAALLMPACSYFSNGTMTQAAVQEFLSAERMALTAAAPGWLLESDDIHPLTPLQITRLKTILSQASRRRLSERYYRLPADSGTPAPAGKSFYLYADNAQCLSGRLDGAQVYLDDFDLDESTRRELATLLKSQLAKLR